MILLARRHRPACSGSGSREPTLDAILDQTEALVTHEVLLAHLGWLDPRQRVGIVLRYYEDLTQSQTAEVMGCSVGAVKSQISVELGRVSRTC